MKVANIKGKKLPQNEVKVTKEKKKKNAKGSERTISSERVSKKKNSRKIKSSGTTNKVYIYPRRPGKISFSH